MTDKKKSVLDKREKLAGVKVVEKGGAYYLPDLNDDDTEKLNRFIKEKIKRGPNPLS